MSATDIWLASLRRQFLVVARRRVGASSAEDLVQETLRILVEKGVREAGALAPGGIPALAFGLAVLRNVIGNHYQRERTRSATVDLEAAAGVVDATPTPLEALVSSDAVRVVREALAVMDAAGDACARYLGRLLDGHTPHELAREEGIEDPVLYRRVYRCRLKLRDILEQRGILG